MDVSVLKVKKKSVRRACIRVRESDEGEGGAAGGVRVKERSSGIPKGVRQVFL